MKTFFQLLFKLFCLNRISSGKLILVGSITKPIHVKVGFKPRDVSISLGPSGGSPVCAHDEDWFSWSETHNGFIFRAKLVSETREIYWMASR